MSKTALGDSGTASSGRGFQGALALGGAVLVPSNSYPPLALSPSGNAPPNHPAEKLLQILPEAAFRRPHSLGSPTDVS